MMVKKFLDDLTARYRDKYGVSLRLKHSKSIGYYFELNSSNHQKLDSKLFMHCRTNKSTMCYKTQELMDLEFKINRADSEALEKEEEIFKKLTERVLNCSVKIMEAAAIMANVDVSSALALLAYENGYTRPNIIQGIEFKVNSGRHVTVELCQQKTSFTSNDCHLDENTLIWLITGANMGGKSTFLRQQALITILSQMGSFVPAALSNIGIVDAVYSRVGTSDDLSNNRSTFMVEMLETASILRQATSKSLVIMDEIGRGTATLDGLAIAQAVIEHLHNVIHCRTLFATHYHELTNLEDTLPKLKCNYVAVEFSDSGKNPNFLHKILPGRANRSYGIAVAKLAGTPLPVIHRALELLEQFETEKKK